MNYNIGYDYFTPNSGDVFQKECGACKTKMNKQEGVFTSLKGGAKRKADIFRCSNSGQAWHDQIIALMKYIERLPSRTLSAVLEEEINEIRMSRRPTKPSLFPDIEGVF